MGTCFETSVEKHGEPRRVKPVGFTASGAGDSARMADLNSGCRLWVESDHRLASALGGKVPLAFRSGHSLPLDVLAFAAVAETDDVALVVTVEDLAGARRARDEKQILRFGPKLGFLATFALPE